MRPLGVILAGGQARRMGGDKALVPLGGRPMLAHVADRLAPQLRGLALSANGPAADYAFAGLPVLPDPLPGQPGPMAGLLAGMTWAAGQGASHVVAVSVDTPFLPHDLVARLAAARGCDGAQVAFAESLGQVQPIIGLWPVALAGAVRADLARGQRRVWPFAKAQGLALARFEATEDTDPFFNVNTPEDLAIAEERLKKEQ